MCTAIIIVVVIRVPAIQRLAQAGRALAALAWRGALVHRGLEVHLERAAAVRVLLALEPRLLGRVKVTIAFLFVLALTLAVLGAITGARGTGVFARGAVRSTTHAVIIIIFLVIVIVIVEASHANLDARLAALQRELNGAPVALLVTRLALPDACMD